MSTEPELISLPDAADRLGITVSRVRELVRERSLIAVRAGDNNAWHTAADFLVDGDAGIEVLPTLRGTLTLLGDAGFADDEALEWLTTDSDELGCSPLEALREGRRSHVRRIAQSLF